LYFTGQGVSQDYGAAFQWWGKAAEQDDARAEASLGTMYESGYGTLQSYEKAAESYRRAALQGVASAQFHLGLLYEKGEGVKQDYVAAFDWYKEASKAGYPDAAGRAASIESAVDRIEQAKAAGYDSEKGPYGDPGVELIGTVLSVSTVAASDAPNHVISRELMSFRADYQNGYQEWFELVCLDTVLGTPYRSSPITETTPTRNSCGTFISGKKYRFVSSERATAMDFHPSKSMYPYSEFQVWNRCIGTRDNCVPEVRGPILAIRRPGGSIEQ
jgi:TPR repeat protein